jgi:hypothetical protein
MAGPFVCNPFRHLPCSAPMGAGQIFAEGYPTLTRQAAWRRLTQETMR